MSVRAALLVILMGASPALAQTLAAPASADASSAAAAPDEAAVLTPPAPFLFCTAVDDAAVIRSDVVDPGTRSVAAVRQAWSSYVGAARPQARDLECQVARAAGKTAAYGELDARVRRLMRGAGRRAAVFTGWRG